MIKRICILCCCIFTAVTIFAQNTVSLKNHKQLELSDIMRDNRIKDIEYILLETSDQPIVEDNILDLFLIGDYIFIEYESDILQFDRKGKYICCINQVGQKSVEYFTVKKDQDICSAANFTPNNRNIIQYGFNEKVEFNYYKEDRESIFDIQNIEKINQSLLQLYYKQAGKSLSTEIFSLLNNIHLDKIVQNNAYKCRIIQSAELKKQLAESKSKIRYFEKQKTLEEFINHIDDENSLVLIIVKLK